MQTQEEKKKRAIKRFYSRLIYTDDCWKMSGRCNCYGYSNFHLLGQHITAHRASYLLFRGEILPGHVIRHSCDNPSCVNPAHLSTGTHNDNVQDRVSRNRSANGEKNGRSKLSKADVIAIRRRFAAGEQQTKLASEFRVSRRLIGKIVRGELWKNLFIPE